MSPLDRVLSYVDDSAEQMIADLLPVLRQPSISATGEGIRECAEMLARLLTDEGIEAQIVETAGHPVVVGRTADVVDAPRLLVYGHYDVQPADPLEDWATPPFEPTIRDGRIYGRGSGDNKGQFFAQLMGYRAWRAVAGNAPINLTFVLDGEEECGSEHLPDFARANPDLVAADVAYLSDGPVDDSGSYRVVLGVRGILALELRTSGASRDYHSGHLGNLLPNPAWELVEALHTMRASDGRILIDGFFDGVQEPDAATRDAVAALPVDLPAFFRDHGVDHLAPLPEAGFHERLMFQPTLNISGLQAGYAGQGSKTIIPNTAVARLDIRLVVDQDPADIYRKVCRHLERHAPGVTVRQLGGGVRPSRTPVHHPAVDLIRDAVERATGETPLVLPSTGGTLPDYVFTEIAGLPLVKVPYANADEANHAPNENLELARFVSGVRIAAAVYDAMARFT